MCLEGYEQEAERRVVAKPEEVLNFHLPSGAQSLGTVNGYLRQQG